MGRDVPKKSLDETVDDLNTPTRLAIGRVEGVHRLEKAGAKDRETVISWLIISSPFSQTNSQDEEDRRLSPVWSVTISLLRP